MFSTSYFCIVNILPSIYIDRVMKPRIVFQLLIEYNSLNFEKYLKSAYLLYFLITVFHCCFNAIIGLLDRRMT